MAHMKLRAGKRTKFADPEGHFERMMNLLRKEAQSTTGRSSSSLGTLAFSSTTTSQQTQVIIADERQKMEAIQQQLVRQESSSSNATYNPSILSASSTSKKTGRASSVAPDFKEPKEPTKQEISRQETKSRIEISRPYPNKSNSTAKWTGQLKKEATVAEVEQKTGAHSVHDGSIHVVDDSKKFDNVRAVEPQSAVVTNDGESSSSGRRNRKSGKLAALKSQQAKEFTKIDNRKGKARKTNSDTQRSTESSGKSAPKQSSEDLKSTEPKSSSESLQLTKIIRENMAESSTFDSSDFISDCTTDLSQLNSEAVEQTSPKLKGSTTVIQKLPPAEDTPKLSRRDRPNFMPFTSTPAPGRAASLDSSISLIQTFKNAANSQKKNLASSQKSFHPTAKTPKRVAQLRGSERKSGPVTSTPLRKMPFDLDASAIVGPSRASYVSVNEVFSPELENGQKRKQTAPKRRNTIDKRQIDLADAAPIRVLRRNVNTPIPKSYKMSTTRVRKQRLSGAKKAVEKKATYALGSVAEMSKDDCTNPTTMHSVSSFSEDTSVVAELHKKASKNVQSVNRKVAPVKESKQRKRHGGVSLSEVAEVASPPKRARRDHQSNKKFETSADEETLLSSGGKLLPRRENMKKKEVPISASDNRKSALPIRELRSVKGRTAYSNSGKKKVGAIDQRSYPQSSWPSGAISSSSREDSVFGCDNESTFSYTPTFVGPQISKASYANVSSIEEGDSNSAHSRSSESERASEKQSEKKTYAVDDDDATKSEDLSEVQSPPTISYCANGHASTEIVNLPADEQSSSETSSRRSSFDSTLPTPEISWGNTRKKTPGKRRSSRTRVRRLRPELGEVVKYEYVEGGLRRIAGVVPGHVDIPVLKRNRVHTMSQYVEVLCEKRNRRRKGVGSSNASIGGSQFDNVAFGKPLLTGAEADAAMDGRLFRLSKASEEQVTDRVLKYEYEEDSETHKVQIEIRRGGEVNLNVENKEINQQTQSTSGFGFLTSSPAKEEIPDLTISLSTIKGASDEDSDSGNFSIKLEGAQKREQIPETHVNRPLRNSVEGSISQLEKQRRYGAEKALAPLIEIFKNDSPSVDAAHSTSLSDNVLIVTESRRRADMNGQTTKGELVSIKEKKRWKQHDNACLYEVTKDSLAPKRAKKDDRRNKKFKASLSTGGDLVPHPKKTKRKSEQSMEWSKEIEMAVDQAKRLPSKLGSSGYSSSLPSPEISWGQDREKTPERRRSSRTRVPRLRPELGEVVKYEYVEGGLRQIVGVVPGHVDIPLLKRNKVHTMTEYVDRLCEKRLKRRNVRRKPSRKEAQSDEMAVSELHSVTPDGGDELIERGPFRFECHEIFDGVAKYEHDEVAAIAQMKIRRGAQFSLNVERDETFCVVRGAIVVTLNEWRTSLSAEDFVILRAGDSLTVKNNGRKKAYIVTCLR
ncbi:hypothetical protein TTRE_0000670001 [Trichuris trichiura]|uniref:Uncharacterized protein n=1 Tax=Trichuris trichiura TaxID=36087 RepID=A0A077ZIG3_TRITR|nr:hypothetical protein TTRE_0000670001 [Trichuris trichiura]